MQETKNTNAIPWGTNIPAQFGWGSVNSAFVTGEIMTRITVKKKNDKLKRVQRKGMRVIKGLNLA